MGHATRCVPLIRQLQAENTVILGVTPLTSFIFDEEFPELKKISIEPYNIKYSLKIPFWFKLILESPRILSVIRKEREQLKKIIHDNQVDVVISDNRFGLYNSRAYCIYITHQLHIQAGSFSGLANRIHHSYMKRYREIWVPDFESDQEAVAGKLSRKTKPFKTNYLGVLSRLTKVEKSDNPYDYLCLLSGPEPFRTEMENVLMQQAVKSEKNICLVRGSHLAMEDVPPINVHVYDLPSATELSKLIAGTKTIICRSGYSTLMDLRTLKKANCILVPTPGQTEQEYLAYYWHKKFNTRILKQSELSNFEF